MRSGPHDPTAARGCASGEQRMDARIWGDDDGVIEIGGAECTVPRVRKGEIDDPVVDEVDGLSVGQQSGAS